MRREGGGYALGRAKKGKWEGLFVVVAGGSGGSGVGVGVSAGVGVGGIGVGVGCVGVGIGVAVVAVVAVAADVFVDVVVAVDCDIVLALVIFLVLAYDADVDVVDVTVCYCCCRHGGSLSFIRTSTSAWTLFWECFRSSVGRPRLARKGLSTPYTSSYCRAPWMQRCVGLELSASATVSVF